MKLAARTALSILTLCAFAPAAHAVATKVLFTPTGTANEDVGSDVANAGDFNGDGYPDVIVGANNWGGAQGRAYIYFGGPGADSIPDVTLTGTSVGVERFGTAVSGAGDVNGDGFADVIVGAYLADTIANNVGKAYLFHGGAVPDVTPDVIFAGTTEDDRFGIDVSGAGDFNGDGFDDIIVGADQAFAGANLGKAYLYYGGPGMDAVPDLTLLGEFFGGSRFGSSVSDAGDFNGDGYDDVVVGAEY